MNTASSKHDALTIVAVAALDCILGDVRSQGDGLPTEHLVNPFWGIRMRIRSTNGVVEKSVIAKFTWTVILMLATVIPAMSWGPEGHQIVAALADARLNQNARAAIRSLIGDASLASISSWADEIRHDRDETYNWHFVDIPWDSSGFSDERDCFLPDNQHRDAATDHHNCVVDRIEIFERVLANENVPRAERVEALKFLVHFVGDIHQPMHAITKAAGGNGITVIEFGSAECGQHQCNLHGAWDSGLIRHTAMSNDQYAAHLENSDEHLVASGNPVDWANESHDLARSAWLEDGGQVDENYYRNEIKVVDERLAVAGLRLAGLLNRALSSVGN